MSAIPFKNINVIIYFMEYPTSQQNQNEFLLVEQERLEEDIDNLYRYVDLLELISLFGGGKSFTDRVTEGINNPDLWFCLNVRRQEISNKEISELQKVLGQTYSSNLPPLTELGNSDFDKLLIKFGKPGYSKLSEISSTVRGFGVNKPASGYETPYLLKVYLDKKIQVKDLKGDKKIVLFEPTYVSTPLIKISSLREELLPDGILQISLWGEFVE